MKVAFERVSGGGRACKATAPRALLGRRAAAACRGLLSSLGADSPSPHTCLHLHPCSPNPAGRAVAAPRLPACDRGGGAAAAGEARGAAGAVCLAKRLRRRRQPAGRQPVPAPGPDAGHDAGGAGEREREGGGGVGRAWELLWQRRGLPTRGEQPGKERGGDARRLQLAGLPAVPLALPFGGPHLL